MPPRPNRSVGTGAKVLGVVAIVVAVGALFAFLPDPGSKPRPPAEAEEAATVEPQTPLEQMAGVCAGKSVPIKRAKAYDGKPGQHRVEAVMIAPEGRWPELGTERLPLPDGWNSPEEAADVKVEEVELVGCYVITNARLERTCDFEGGFTQQLWVMSGRLVVREARTGREVLRQDLPEHPEGRCGNLAITGDELVYGWWWSQQVTDALRPLSGAP